MIRVPAADLTDLVARVFAAEGASEGEARRIAENLVDTNLAGHDSHGVVRVPRYVQYARDGHVAYGVEPEVVTDTGALLLLDGRLGFGQSLGHRVVREGVARAREHGAAVVAMRSAGHLGRIGAWAEDAAAQSIVSVHFVNVGRSALVAPFGGAERRMSTAPVCVGVPDGEGGGSEGRDGRTGGGRPFILDFATSRVAEGKALVALQGGAALPEGALVDGEGRPTADPHALYGTVPPGTVPDPREGPGALVAMGDHKGSGLALACELLAGALTGSGATGPGQGARNGWLAIFVDPARLDEGRDGGGGWAQAVADYVAWVRAARPAAGHERVLVPGDRERATRAERLAQGVPLPEATWNAINACLEPA